MAGTNNFLQHNPGQANQETDPAYAADNIRNSGLGTGNIVPSPWMNKVLYQTSTMCAALAQMMANKGFNMSDADIVQLTNTLANLLTNNDSKPPLISVPFSNTPTFDASQANGFDFVMNGNVTGSNLINMQIGQIVTFIITQSGAGGNTFAWPGNVQGAEPIQSGANTITVQSFIKNEAGNIVAFTAQPYFIPTAAQLGFTSGQNGNGYWSKDPTGKITQWGYLYGSVGGGSQNFPIPFTNAASISVNCNNIESGGELHSLYVQPYPSVNGFSFVVSNSDGDNVTTLGYFWQAVGY